MVLFLKAKYHGTEAFKFKSELKKRMWRFTFLFSSKIFYKENGRESVRADIK
jgi:hypothetical protein